MENNGANTKPVVQAGKGGAGKTKWKEWGGVVVVAAVIAAGGYFLMNGTAKAPSEAEDTSATLEAMVGETTHTYSWAFAPAQGDSATGAYRYQVTLTVDGTAHDVGTFNGPCAVIGGVESEWPLMENELTGVICSFNGVGDEVGVFLNGMTVVVKKGVLEQGTAEAPGMRGNYETLFAL